MKYRYKITSRAHGFFEQIEIEVVSKDPDSVGINIDQDLIIDGIYSRGLDAVKAEWEVRYGPDGKAALEAAEQTGTAETELDKRVQEQKLKLGKLRDYLAKFPYLKHVRVHPYGVESPITPAQAIQVATDGTRRVDINSDFLEQMQMIVDKSTDPTLVVQFYDSRRGAEKCSDIPETIDQISDYIAICDALLNQFGDRLQIEIGNETNVTRETGEMFTSKQFATHTDPHEYAKFYITVATALKERYPNAKLAMGGLACYDSGYLTTVLSDVKAYEVQHNINNLIDTVSIHPYRQNPEQGAVKIHQGKFANRPMTYDQQIAKLLDMARNYNPQTRAVIGEIGFSPTDQSNQQKLERSIELTKQKGMVSYIYPAINIP